jgi:hypothetical protein
MSRQWSGLDSGTALRCQGSSEQTWRSENRECIKILTNHVPMAGLLSICPPSWRRDSSTSPHLCRHSTPATQKQTVPYCYILRFRGLESHTTSQFGHHSKPACTPSDYQKFARSTLSVTAQLCAYGARRLLITCHHPRYNRYNNREHGRAPRYHTWGVHPSPSPPYPSTQVRFASSQPSS